MKTQQLVAMLLGVCLVSGSPADDLQRARDLHAAGTIMALGDILSRLPPQPGARVVEVEMKERDGRVVYQIERLEANGRVREYRFDARNGQLLKVEDD